MANEAAERFEVAVEARQLFDKSDFKALDQMAERFRSDRSKTSSGIWKLAIFYFGLNKRSDEAEAIEREGKSRKWVELAPDSPAAHIMLASALLNHGWVFRGTGYASTVSPENWQPFRKYVEMAKTELETSKKIAASDPHWYTMLLEIAKIKGFSEVEVISILSEALAREPDYSENYYRVIEYYLPKWNGSNAGVSEFIDAVVGWTSKTQGSIMYARLAWKLQQADVRRNVFDEYPIEWRRMDASFDELTRRFPTTYNVNAYAEFACMAGDIPRRKELLQKLRDMSGQNEPLLRIPAELRAKCEN